MYRRVRYFQKRKRKNRLGTVRKLRFSDSFFTLIGLESYPNDKKDACNKITLFAAENNSEEK